MPKVSSIEKKLWEKANQAIKEQEKIRKPKLEDIFTRRYYISPESLLVDNYLRTKPLAAFNPGAFVKDGRLFIFPRLIFDYYSYVSSIGVAVMDIEKVIDGKLKNPLKVKIILWPEKLWEFGHGCEDPRVSSLNGSIYILYTGAKHYYVNQGITKKSVLGFAELNSFFEIKRRGYFSIASEANKFTPSCKDSALIKIKDNKATMLTRPIFQNIALCWRAEANLKTLTIPEDTLKPVLLHEEWEYRVGWSTNVVKLSPDEYLVGWHGVLKEDLSYRNGIAVVDGKGELLAISNYLLAPRGLKESYGDRPLAIFGNGLVRYKEYLVWIGGIGDYSIGIFITELSKVLENLKWIKKSKQWRQACSESRLGENLL